MRLETMKIRDAPTLYGATNSIEDTFFRRNHVTLNWIAMCLCQWFQTPGRQGAVANIFCTVTLIFADYWYLNYVMSLLTGILR